MDDIGKLFGMGIVVAVADVVLTQAGRKDIAYAVTIAGFGTALLIVVPQIANIFNETIRLFRF